MTPTSLLLSALLCFTAAMPVIMLLITMLMPELEFNLEARKRSKDGLPDRRRGGATRNVPTPEECLNA
ncbi:hypothetical protein AB3R30_19805 [Leptolyngbyaceae cyanobacterium UHCC 1019]